MIARWGGEAIHSATMCSGLAKEPVHEREVRVSELLPFRDNRETVAPLERHVGTFAVCQSVAVQRSHVGHGFRIVDAQPNAVGHHLPVAYP